MRLWPFRRVEVTEYPTREDFKGFTLGFDPESVAFSGLQTADALLEEIGGFSRGRISRADALKASVVLRARNLISGVPATLPLELRDRDRVLDDRPWLGSEITPGVEDTFTIAQTLEDLLFEGVSWWRVTTRHYEGFPVHAYRVNPRAISQVGGFTDPSRTLSDDHPHSPDDTVYVDGRPTSSRDMIRFLSPNPPLLVHAARAIRTVLLLDQVATDYASDPLPFGYFTDQADEESLDDTEVNEVLTRWGMARRRKKWAYIPSGLNLKMLEWPSPQSLQLGTARNHAILDVARATGLDPEDVGVNIEGTSRTYQNAEQRRLDLIDFTLMPYISSIQQRLSMNDIIPRGVYAHFDATQFTRADFKSRMEGAAIAMNTRLMTINEGRRREGLPDLTREEIQEMEEVLPRGGSSGGSSTRPLRAVRSESG